MRAFRIVITGCARGYGIVKDYLGNTWFYGTMEDCQLWIINVERLLDESVHATMV